MSTARDEGHLLCANWASTERELNQLWDTIKEAK